MLNMYHVCDIVVVQMLIIEWVAMLVDSCQQDNCSPVPTAKRKIIPGTKFDLDLTLSPSSSLPDLSDLDGQRTPDDDDTNLSDLHDGEPGDLLSNSIFGPVLDWEGELLCHY